MRTSIVVAAAALLGVILGSTGDVGAQRPPEAVAQGDIKLDEGIDIQTRGPVHEAFAQPVSRDPEASPLVRKQPPEPVPELPPELKPEGEASMWIPGYWAWDEEREDYLWVSGTWRVPPPDRTWVPGYWDDEEGGWRWVAGYWAVQGEAQVELYPEPPAPIQEAIPEQVQEGTTYVPGNWVYRTDRYWWRPGYWVGHRPGWVWVNPCYYWTPAGYAFTDGYWDHDFHRRGLLFAPVHFHRPYWQQAGWHYRPHYAIHTDFLFGSLFVHVGHRHYFFGDYYAPRYASSGYHPWATYRYGGGRHYDPVFAYYRWHHRDGDRWEEGIREQYVARREGRAPLPPRTFREQQQQQQTAKQGTDVRVVVPITNINKVKTNVKLAPVTKIELQQAQKTAQEIQTVRTARAKVEKRARVEAKGVAKQPVKLDVPRVQFNARATAKQDTPPPPPLPKAVEKTPAVGKPKVRDVEPPKVDIDTPKRRDVDTPKGREVTPKGKEIPKAKEVQKEVPKAKEVAPKPKEIEPKGKGKDVEPKGKDKDKEVERPKGKDIERPKAREVAPPPARELPPPRPKDVEPVKPSTKPSVIRPRDEPREVEPVKPSTKPSVIRPRDEPREVREPAPRAVPKAPATRRDPDEVRRPAPPQDVTPDRPERRPPPRPADEKERKRDRDRPDRE